MARIVDANRLEHLSVTGRMLQYQPLDVITDVVRVIKRAEIRNWNLVPVFTELRISLDLYLKANQQSAIVDITFNPVEELISFHIFREVVSLTTKDVRRIQMLPPVPS